MGIEDATEIIRAVCVSALNAKGFQYRGIASLDKVRFEVPIWVGLDFSAVVHRMAYQITEKRKTERILIYRSAEGRMFIDPNTLSYTPQEIDRLVSSIVNFICNTLARMPIEKLIIAFDGYPSPYKIRCSTLPDDMRVSMCRELEIIATGTHVGLDVLEAMNRWRIDAGKYSYCESFDINFMRALYTISRLEVFGWEKVAESFFSYYSSSAGTKWFFNNANDLLFGDRLTAGVAHSWIMRIMPIMRASQSPSCKILQKLVSAQLICKIKYESVICARFEAQHVAQTPPDQCKYTMPALFITGLDLIPAKTEADFVLMNVAKEAAAANRPYVIVGSDMDYLICEGDTYLYWPTRDAKTTKLVNIRLFWTTVYDNILKQRFDVGTFADIVEFTFCMFVSRGTDYTPSRNLSVAKLIKAFNSGIPYTLHYEGEPWYCDEIWKGVCDSRLAYYSKLFARAIEDYNQNKQTYGIRSEGLNMWLG